MDEPETDLVAPTDPRDAWHLPAFGSMPTVADLDPLVTRVLAPNASPMTLDGTNTYVIGEPGSGEVVVLDPGPDEPSHLARVESVVVARDAALRAVVVTHHHHDHAEAARAWARRFGCSVIASSRDVAGPDGRVVADGERVGLAGSHLEVMDTPGHTDDHVAFRLQSGALLTGDHVLGRGTSVVAYPDGDLVAYLDSLQRVHDLAPDMLYPGHGPELTEDPTAVINFYRDHRRFRGRQVLAALAGGPLTPLQLVARIYADVDRRLWPAAEASTRATLDALRSDDMVRPAGDDRVELVPDP